MIPIDVGFRQPVSRVFGFLADPVNRPLWQASLRSVDILTPGPPRLGTCWRDVTWPGLRPLLEITAWQTDRLWAERGTLGGVEVTLDLRFTDLTEDGRGVVPGTCQTLVRATTSVVAPGWRYPIVWGLAAFGPVVARDDLRRADRLLSR